MHSWGAVFLMNVFIAATLGFADFAHQGAGIVRILFHIFATVCVGLLVTKSFAFIRRLRASLDEDG